jgi:glyoxylase-like metal-dependent hydrolase (beta-lactamase superfamily II)
VIATPGHSPDSICLCLFESGLPIALFSGDTLFAGDVGRPDLRDRELETASQNLSSTSSNILAPQIVIARKPVGWQGATKAFLAIRNPFNPNYLSLELSKKGLTPS